MSTGPVDFINEIASKLVTIVTNLTPDVRLKLHQGGNHAIQWDTDSNEPFATFGLRSDGIDWIYVNDAIRKELDGWSSSSTKFDKDELEQEFFEQLTKVLEDLGLGYDKNISNVLLFIDVPKLIENNIFLITTNQPFNWLDIDMDILTETMYKIAAIHVIGYSFFVNSFMDDDQED